MSGIRPNHYKVKLTLNTSIYIGLGAAIFGILSGLSKLDLIIIACSLIGFLGVYLTVKRRKSAVLSFMIASLIAVITRFTGDSFIAYPVSGLFFSLASMNDFYIINLEAPTSLEGSEDFSDIMKLQAVWFAKVKGFISQYTIFAYFGYIFIVFACMFLSGVWLFADEIIKGYSREFWALLAAGGLVAFYGIIYGIFKGK